jgi:hypothetical protein
MGRFFSLGICVAFVGDAFGLYVGVSRALVMDLSRLFRATPEKALQGEGWLRWRRNFKHLPHWRLTLPIAVKKAPLQRFSSAAEVQRRPTLPLSLMRFSGVARKSLEGSIPTNTMAP